METLRKEACFILGREAIEKRGEVASAPLHKACSRCCVERGPGWGRGQVTLPYSKWEMRVARIRVWG